MSRHEAKHDLKRVPKQRYKHDLKPTPKHRSKVLYAIAAMLLLAVCGTVLAYMLKMTETKTNRFIPATVSCEVKEETDSPLTEKSGIKVKNTGNIDAYIRVRFVSYWVRTSEDGKSEIVAMPSEMPDISLAQEWLKGEDDTYYFQTPVIPGKLTSELLASNITLIEKDGCQQVIKVFAEAIQSRPAEAVSQSWNVTLDADGKIESVNK